MATIKDVARRAGVSPSTASRALHNSHIISKATRERVVKAAHELDYAPDFNAQSLATKASSTVGVILPVDHHEIFSNPFFLEMIRGINEVCSSSGSLITLATGTTREELLNNIDVMIGQGHIRTFILLYSEQDDPVLARLNENNVQYVVIGKPYTAVNKTSYVNNDNIQAGSDATRYLLKYGHEKVCFLYSDLSKMVQSDRILGYQRVMMQNQLPNIMLEERFENHNHSMQTLTRFFETYPDITGFVVVDDMLALKLQQVLHSKSEWQNKQLSLIGFNDSVFSDVAHPTLTSVAVFPERLGEEAAKIALIDHSETELSTAVIVPHQIVVRHSVFDVRK
ncbi:LacI family DNA-binding transcriptional regulator [Lactiplantibacillus pentosus]|jgi:LacI family transcriptional regulator|uniref:LacI family DNA-binding transcriptional regulator n=1 Tax=Lactiplantibacillus pentosus TaxID=1589 RepID=UPI000D01E5D7|nr:LacI family DNA-binding transcriptional regulator [Lactiplantibacillus pentosus]MCS8602533.1 LacI family transcriptional regulator [Lactiplantibacillus pentosus]PRO83308.1 LacI family transcriptional regulator [Lactiplantibacillus pentosus]